MTVAPDAQNLDKEENGSEDDPTLSAENAKQKEFTPPKDGSWVPRERLNNLSAEVKDLRAKIDEQAKVQNAPKLVPRDELLAKVDAGELTQAQADEQWQLQIESNVADQVEIVVKNTANATKMQNELAKYEETVPELRDESSELYGRVAKEYAYMTGTLGMPDTTQTTIAALRATVGPVESLKKVEIKKPNGDSHEETGSGSAGGGSGSNSDTPELSPRQKEYYRNAIRMGAYKDWDEVHAELKDYNKV